MKTILIVEDNKDLCELMVDFFGEIYNVLVASNGRDGLELFKSNLPGVDLVITDFNMPIMSGFEMVSNIRSISKQVKILVFSSSISEPQRLCNAIGINIDKFLQKPSNLLEIETTIYNLLSS